MLKLREQGIASSHRTKNFNDFGQFISNVLAALFSTLFLDTFLSQRDKNEEKEDCRSFQGPLKIRFSGSVSISPSSLLMILLFIYLLLLFK